MGFGTRFILVRLRGTAKDIEVGLKSDAAAETPDAAKEGADAKSAEADAAAPRVLRRGLGGTCW